MVGVGLGEGFELTGFYALQAMFDFVCLARNYKIDLSSGLLAPKLYLLLEILVKKTKKNGILQQFTVIYSARKLGEVL